MDSLASEVAALAYAARRQFPAVHGGLWCWAVDCSPILRNGGLDHLRCRADGAVRRAFHDATPRVVGAEEMAQ